MRLLMRDSPDRPGALEIFTRGFSAAARHVEEPIEEERRRWQQTVLGRRASLEARFRDLTSQWKEDTEYYSTMAQIASHPAYQEIIDMGWPALPFILKDLGENGGMWFGALYAITQQDPVPPEDRGYIDRMTRAWLRWGVQNNVL